MFVFFFFWPIVGSTIPHKRDGGGGRNYRILCQNFSYHLTLIKNFYRWESNYCMVAIISWLQRNSYSFAYPSLNFKQRTKIRIKSKASSIIYVLTSYKSDLYFWWFSIAVFSSNPRIVISRPLFFFKKTISKLICRYATEVDVDFVRKSVRAIGRCAIKVEVTSVYCCFKKCI